MKIAALAGGVGGARLAEGLARNLNPGELTVIVNTGDDFEHFGLNISPDLDTVCYTLAGLVNQEMGWGRENETWNALESAEALGAPGWFRVGDRDLGTHLERTRRLQNGDPLSLITRDFCRAWGVDHLVIPMSDDPVPTMVETSLGLLPFQDYFVRQRCEPVVSGFRFEGIDKAKPAPGVLEALQEADLVVVCPSNPWVSIDPILAVPGIRQRIVEKPVVAVTPIIGGKAVKGPAAKMFSELGFLPSGLAVAEHYGAQRSGGLLTGFILDLTDPGLQARIETLGVKVFLTNTMMRSASDRSRLGSEVLAFAENLVGQKEFKN
jgi:LPPG:FO 2-phospho-L-lactate transferase